MKPQAVYYFELETTIALLALKTIMKMLLQVKDLEQNLTQLEVQVSSRNG